MYKKGWSQTGCLRRGGGSGTESQRLESTAQAATWEEYDRGIEPPFH